MKITDRLFPSDYELSVITLRDAVFRIAFFMSVNVVIKRLKLYTAVQKGGWNFDYFQGKKTVRKSFL